MDVIVRVSWKSGNVYYSKFANDFGATFPVLPKIKNISPLTTSIDIFTKSFTSTTTAIVLDNRDDNFTDRMIDSTDNIMRGIDIWIYAREKDGTQTLKRKMFLQDRFIDTVNNTFTIIASDNYNELNSTYLEVITDEQYPDAHFDAYGKPIPKLFGIINSISTGTIYAYRVDDSGTDRYILGTTAYGGTVASIQAVYTPIDGDVTGTSSLSTTGDYQYINYSATTEDYLKVNCTTTITNYNGQGIINSVIDQWNFFEGDHPVTNTDLNDMLEYMNLDRSQYDLDDSITGKEIIQIGANNIETDWWFDKDKTINYSFFNPNNKPVPTVFIYEADVQKFQYIDEYDYIKGRIIGKFKYKNTDSKFRQALTVENKENKSNVQDNYGINSFDYEFRYYNDKISTYNIMKYKMIMNDRLVLFANVQIPIKSVHIAVDNYNVGQFIYMTHSQAISTGRRLYKIVKKSIDWDNDLINYMLQDIEHLNTDLDSETKFLINSDTFNGATRIWNTSGGGYLQLDNSGLFHSTTQKKFDGSSIRADGSSHAVSDTDSSASSLTDLDIADTTITSGFTLEAFLRFDATGSTEHIYNQYLNDDNRIQFNKQTGDAMQFRIRDAAAAVVNLVTTSTLSATTWYHVAVIRVGSDWGIYLDGTLEAYVSNANSYPINAGGLWCVDGGMAAFFTGYMDAFRISQGNPYGAAPAALPGGDSIVVPVNAPNWYNAAGT